MSAGNGVLSQRKTGPAVTLTNYLHPAPRLRMSGAKALFPLYALMVWTRQGHLFSPLQSISMCSKLSYTLYMLLSSKCLLHVPLIQSSFVDQTNNINNTSYAAAYCLISPFIHLLRRLFYVSILFSEFRCQIPSNCLRCSKLSILRIFRILFISVTY